MVKVLIIEPHGDDAICSCSSILQNRNLLIDIATLGESRSSENLVKLFPHINKITYYNLPEIDYSLRPKVSTYDIHKRFLNGEDVYLYYRKNLLLKIAELVPFISSKITDTLLYSLDLEGYDYVLYPVGLIHPYHIEVASIIRLLERGFNTKFVMYGDKPYLSTRYAKECMESFCRLNKLSKIYVNYDERENVVGKALNEVYPTEVTMLKYSSDILLRQPDVFLSKELKFKEDLFDESIVYTSI